MNDDFEQFLSKQPLRPIPPEWRSSILRLDHVMNPHGTDEADTEISSPPLESWCLGGKNRWWRALLWPSPVAWGSVACVWLLIIGMNIASRPSKGETVAIPAASSQDIFITILHERQLVQELFQPEKEPTEPPHRSDPSGACNDCAIHRRTEAV